jgi:hypothetical protein
MPRFQLLLLLHIHLFQMPTLQVSALFSQNSGSLFLSSNEVSSRRFLLLLGEKEWKQHIMEHHGLLD